MQNIQLELNVRLSVDDKGDFTALCPRCKQEIETKETNVKSVSLNSNDELEFFLEEPQECKSEKKKLTYVIIPISSATKRFSLQKNSKNSDEYLDLLCGTTDISTDDQILIPIPIPMVPSKDEQILIPMVPSKDEQILIPMVPSKDRHLFTFKPIEDYNRDIFYLYYPHQDYKQGNSPIREIAKFTVELEKMDKQYQNTRREDDYCRDILRACFITNFNPSEQMFWSREPESRDIAKFTVEMGKMDKQYQNTRSSISSKSSKY